MNAKALLWVAGAELLVLAFPPVDHVIPSSQPASVAGRVWAGSPEVRRNAGFRFIAGMEPMHRIRMDQWLVQIVALGGIGLLIAKAVPEQK